MSYKSFNPATLTLMKSYSMISDQELTLKLTKSHEAYKKWSRLKLQDRLDFISVLSKQLLHRNDHYAKLISLEMGKPISQARAEIEKSALLCDYYLEHAGQLLQDVTYASNARKSIVHYEPIGSIYGVMPWNFPFWQVFRFFVPNIVLGNTALLKHASNVPQCAEAIENIVFEAGIPEGVFQNLFIDYRQSEMVIASPYVWGVTLTGSEMAGSKVAALAGTHIKKSVLELGGSDPFIVLDDADINSAVEAGIIARMQNAGQSCIAAKRFIIHQKTYDEFVIKYTQAAKKLVLGDPLNEQTFMGPMATPYLLDELESQIAESVKMGAKILTGGQRSPIGHLYFEPTVLSDITEEMPAFHQEIFGPVACIFKVSDDDEAIALANQTEFGLGGALWTQDEKRAFHLAKQIQTGTVAINGGVRSEPRLPFGGTKKSGYGRELADLGLKEFANIKTINIF